MIDGISLSFYRFDQDREEALVFNVMKISPCITSQNHFMMLITTNCHFLSTCHNMTLKDILHIL